jgi:GTP-binding protein Era
VPVDRAVNKIDLVRDKALLLPLLASVSRCFAFARSFRYRRTRARSCRACGRRSCRALPESPPLYPRDDLTDRDERFPRGRVHPREDLPACWATEVALRDDGGVEQFVVDGSLRRITATVYVDKASQRAIPARAKAARA